MIYLLSYLLFSFLLAVLIGNFIAVGQGSPRGEDESAAGSRDGKDAKK